MRTTPQPVHPFCFLRQLAGQTDTCRMRRAAGNIDINGDLHFAVAVDAPGFTADKQGFTLILPGVNGGYLNRVCKGIGFALQQHRLRLVMPGGFPALNPGIRIDPCHLTDTNIVIQRRAGKLIAQWRQ